MVLGVAKGRGSGEARSEAESLSLDVYESITGQIKILCSAIYIHRKVRGQSPLQSVPRAYLDSVPRLHVLDQYPCRRRCFSNHYSILYFLRGGEKAEARK